MEVEKTAAIVTVMKSDGSAVLAPQVAKVEAVTPKVEAEAVADVDIPGVAAGSIVTDRVSIDRRVGIGYVE